MILLLLKKSHSPFFLNLELVSLFHQESYYSLLDFRWLMTFFLSLACSRVRRRAITQLRAIVHFPTFANSYHRIKTLLLVSNINFTFPL